MFSINAKKAVDWEGEICLAVRSARQCLPMRHIMTSITRALEEANAELVASELRCREIRQGIANLEAAQQRLTPASERPNGQNGTGHFVGLTDAVRHVFDAEPAQIFCTARIREILEKQGLDTRPRVFGSALSTILTRLGKNGFITITTNADGKRDYRRM